MILKSDFYLKFSLILFTVLSFNACQPDDLDEDANPSDKFIGDWGVIETDNGNERKYNVDIKASPDIENQVRIYNFYNLGEESYIKATVSSFDENQISIVDGELNNHYFEGEGGRYYDNETISIDFKVDDGNVSNPFPVNIFLTK